MRPGSRGVTLIEGAVLFAVVGGVLAVTVPTVLREVRASRFVEPVSGLEAIGASAIALAQGKPSRDAFPRSVTLTPAEVPRGVRIVDPPGTWDAPTWHALSFRPGPEGAPHSFAFAFTSGVAGAKGSFLAEAHGDLDGDGITSTFEVRGGVTDGDPAGPTLEPGMHIEAEVE